MKVWSLSSGSSGNCYLIQEERTLLLMEAGLGIRRIEFELLRLNISPALLSAILVSHEHSDHWASAVTLARRLRVPVVCTPGTWAAGGGLRYPSCEHVPLVAGQSLRVGCLAVEAFSLPHDAREPVGFAIRTSSASALMATDMGYAGPDVVALARESNLVILEANHDVDMLMRGPYPAHLKTRILGDRGHLSNEDAGRAIVGMTNGQPHHIWLAHLSHTNNLPQLALTSVRSVLKAEGLDNLNLSVALRDRRSLFWDSDEVMTQLPLF